MGYDVAWLRRVRAMKNRIPYIEELIKEVPDVGDRFVIKQQFDAAKESFLACLAKGDSTAFYEGQIRALHDLAYGLVHPEEDLCEDECS